MSDEVLRWAQTLIVPALGVIGWLVRSVLAETREIHTEIGKVRAEIGTVREGLIRMEQWRSDFHREVDRRLSRLEQSLPCQHNGAM